MGFEPVTSRHRCDVSLCKSYVKEFLNKGISFSLRKSTRGNIYVRQLQSSLTLLSVKIDDSSRSTHQYANLFVGFIENKFFSNYHGPKPDLYKRYIDDCVGASSSTKEELNLFINSVNSFHPALKYTWEISENH